MPSLCRGYIALALIYHNCNYTSVAAFGKFFLSERAVPFSSKIATASMPFSHLCLTHSPYRASRAMPGCSFCLSLPGLHGFLPLYPPKPQRSLHNLFLLPSPCSLLFYPPPCYFYQGAEVSASSSSQRLFSSSAKSNSRHIPCTHTQLPKPVRSFCRATPSPDTQSQQTWSHSDKPRRLLSLTGNADTAATTSSIPPSVFPSLPFSAFGPAAASPFCRQPLSPAASAPGLQQLGARQGLNCSRSCLEPLCSRNRSSPAPSPSQAPPFAGAPATPSPLPLHFWFKFPAPYHITK